MSWKDISKSSYIVESAKFTLARPSHPFTIPYQGPKVRYSEGDEISSVADYRFNLDFTSDPLGPNHFPCGYWHKNYIPPFTIIYTSCPYIVEMFDGVAITNISVISGNFRDIYQYGYSADSIISTNINLVSGNFSSIVYTYLYAEGVISNSLALNSGVFKDVIIEYSLSDYINSASVVVASGIFRDVVIDYTYWPNEGISNTAISLTGGSHGS